MFRHLALKPFIVFSTLILCVAWSSPVLAASETKKEKKEKPTSEAAKKPKEAPKKAGETTKKPDQAVKKFDEPSKTPDQAAKNADEPSSKPDEALKKSGASDPLQACLGRIPEDATLGQRMLAEQSCTREDDRRSQSGSAARF